MWEALKKYWPLVGFVLLTCLTSLGFYAWNFHGLRLSDNPGDWASFANYASGTVGVAILGATLLAFVVTLSQQAKMIKQQESHITISDKYQKRMAAYSRAEKIFPILLEERRKELEENCFSFLKDRGALNDFFLDLPMNVSFRGLLSEKEHVYRVLDGSDKGVLVLLCENLHSSNYRLVCFIRDCVVDAEELRGYFNSLLGDDKFIVTATLAFAKHRIGHDELQRICDTLDVPVDMMCELPGTLSHAWNKVGERLAKEGPGVKLAAW